MRKRDYLNAVMHDLIEHLDFIPVRDGSGRYVINDYSLILEKLDVGTYSRVQIMDGDLFNESVLRRHIENSLHYLDAAASTRMEDYELTIVIVTAYGRGNLSFRSMAGYYLAVRNLNIFIVNLAEGTVVGSDQGYLRSAIEYILNNRIYDYRETRIEIEDIDRIIREGRQTVEIENVTNKTPATYSLIALNTIIWIMALFVLIATGVDYITGFGIKDPYLITAGQYWRIFTPMFLHADIMHLATNSFSLYIFGQVVERLFGTHKFVGIYLIAGVLGNILSFAFSPARALGASGAVLGAGGALVYLWKQNRDMFYSRRRQYLTLVFMVFFNIIYGFSRQGIDNFAHIGGALGGYLMAGAIGTKHFRENEGNRMLYAAVVIFLAIAGMLIGFVRFSGYRYMMEFF